MPNRKLEELTAEERANFAQATLDALSAHLCVIDEHGAILATNEAWRAFGEANTPAGQPLRDDDNYLRVCDGVTGPDAPLAAAFAAGLREVIRGDRAEFSMEYTCHSPAEQRWFLARATRFHGKGPTRAVVVHENITIRRQVEHSQSRLAAIVEFSDDAIISKDLGGIVTSWNKGAERLLGYSADEMLGESITRIIPEDRQGEELEIIGRIRQGRVVAHFETVRVTRSGERVNVSLTASPIKDTSGRIIGVSKVARNINERKRAEAELRRSQANLAMAQRIAKIGSWESDLQSQELFWSDQVYEIFGLQKGESPPTYESFLSVVHPEDRELMRRARERAPAGTARLEVEHRVVLPNGIVKIVHELADVTRDEQGKPVRFTGTVQDITERKTAERHIERLNRVYSVLSHINQAIVRETDTRKMLRESCRIAVENGGFAMAWIGLIDDSHDTIEIAGSAGADTETLRVLKMVLGNSVNECACAPTLSSLRTGKPSICNDIANDPSFHGIRAEALKRNYRAMASLPLNLGGCTVGTLNLYSREQNFFDQEEVTLLDELAKDIGFFLQVQDREMQRRHTEAALRQSDRRFNELAETINEVFWITDPSKSQMLFVSPAYEKIWGRSRQSLYDAPGSWLESIHPEDRPQVEAALARQVEGTFNEQYRIVRPDGSIRWVRDRAFPVRDHDGGVERVVGVARDETDRKLAEDQFRQSQKMEAIGQLAGGIAHDFNNILAAMLMQVDLTAFAPGLSKEVLEGLEQLKAGVEKAANLTRQLLLFSRKQVMQPRQLDLNEVVTNLAKMLRRIIGEDITMQLELYSRPLTLRADAGMVDQVLMNLALNARDAMPGGGRLVIKTSEAVVTDAESRSTPDLRPGRYACLEVADAGCGIAPENMARIFEPFFTTKEPGKGTGLGLATVFGIVKQHGGLVRVDSQLGQGATFQVLLPATEKREEDAPPAKEKTPAEGGDERILLVEDEPEVRKVTRHLLQRYGYYVIEAANGLEAVQQWELHRGNVDLMVTDIVMPNGISGRDLAAILQSRNSALKVVFTSGYSPEIAGKEITLQEAKNFIQKPCPPQELLETIRRCLDS